MAAIDLRAGRKAKASAAYASARAYFSAGMALLDESDWTDKYKFTFSLWSATRGMRALSRHRRSRPTDRAVIARADRSRPGRRLRSEGCSDFGSRTPRRCSHCAHMSAPVGHRDTGASDRGSGQSRIRDARASSRRALDRKPYRSAADDRPGAGGRHAGVHRIVTAPAYFADQRLFCSAAIPHGEDQPAARHKHRFRIRLLQSGLYPGLGPLSPLP